jgi:hypothetical protein
MHNAICQVFNAGDLLSAVFLVVYLGKQKALSRGLRLLQTHHLRCRINRLSRLQSDAVGWNRLVINAIYNAIFARAQNKRAANGAARGPSPPLVRRCHAAA